MISLQSKGLSRVFSNTTVQKHQFFSAQSSLWSNSHIHAQLLEKNIALTRWTFVINSVCVSIPIYPFLYLLFFLVSSVNTYVQSQPPSEVFLSVLLQLSYHCLTLHLTSPHHGTLAILAIPSPKVKSPSEKTYICLSLFSYLWVQATYVT